MFGRGGARPPVAPPPSDDDEFEDLDELEVSVVADSAELNRLTSSPEAELAQAVKTVERRGLAAELAAHPPPPEKELAQAVKTVERRGLAAELAAREAELVAREGKAAAGADTEFDDQGATVVSAGSFPEARGRR